MQSKIKKAALGVAAFATVAGLGIGTASAGEITGNGRLKVVQGRSECAYSGLNDGYVGFGGAEPDRVQSYGQLVKQGLKGQLPSPGLACNPNTPPLPEPGA